MLITLACLTLWEGNKEISSSFVYHFIKDRSFLKGSIILCLYLVRFVNRPVCNTIDS